MHLLALIFICCIKIYVCLIFVEHFVLTSALHAMCTTLVPKFITMIREDTERKVVMDVLEALNEMITKVQQPVLQDPKDIETIMSAVGEVFFYKVSNQSQNLVNSCMQIKLCYVIIIVYQISGA